MLVFIYTNNFSQVENLSFTTARDCIVFKRGKYYLSILQKKNIISEWKKEEFAFNEVFFHILIKIHVFNPK